MKYRFDMMQMTKRGNSRKDELTHQLTFTAVTGEGNGPGMGPMGASSITVPMTEEQAANFNFNDEYTLTFVPVSK